jgi:hypothetical protein
MLFLAACSDDRPTLAEWEEDWIRVSSGIPTEAEVTADTTRASCEAGLSLVQVNRVRLLSTPDPAIDDTVHDWVELARTIYFDCPPPDGFPEAFATLDRLEAEIETVLAIDEDEGPAG